MPELPEVETIRRGLKPQLLGRTVTAVIVHNSALRWPIPSNLPGLLVGRPLIDLDRRGKYLLLDCGNGKLIIHLGMSGSLRLVSALTALHKHEHFELRLDNETALRLRDPRRFGAVLWQDPDSPAHRLLANLGPEPLEGTFDAHWLFSASRGRQVSIKQFLMTGTVVAGIGNIYATEALFDAKIHPQAPAGKISLKRYTLLVQSIVRTLQNALAAGGSSLRDFVDSAGQPGYFQQQYQAYGRANKPCGRCGRALHLVRLGQRATVYCGSCQR